MNNEQFEPRFDVACALSMGQRDYQEDSLITDFPIGMDFGFAVLADGMGGHAAGDIASKIIVTEVFSEIKFQSSDISTFESSLPEILNAVALAANECVRMHVTENPDDRGMGATLIAPIFIENRLFWISIGDSPFFLLRDGELQQLNEDHSMAPQIDMMVKAGMMDEETARRHPDRNCLTSVLHGAPIPMIDCPNEAFETKPGDIFVVSSDGLQFLTNDEIHEIVTENRDKSAAAIANQLLSAIEQLDDPDQDNLSFSVIKVNQVRSADAATAPLKLGAVG